MQWLPSTLSSGVQWQIAYGIPNFYGGKKGKKWPSNLSYTAWILLSSNEPLFAPFSHPTFLFLYLPPSLCLFLMHAHMQRQSILWTGKRWAVVVKYKILLCFSQYENQADWKQWNTLEDLIINWWVSVLVNNMFWGFLARTPLGRMQRHLLIWIYPWQVIWIMFNLIHIQLWT